MSLALPSNSYADGTAIYQESLPPTSLLTKKKDEDSEPPPQFNDVLKGEVQANAKQMTKVAVMDCSPLSHLLTEAPTGSEKTTPSIIKTPSTTAELPLSSSPLPIQTRQPNNPSPQFEPTLFDSKTSSKTEDSDPNTLSQIPQQPASVSLQQSYQNLLSGHFSYNSYLASQTATFRIPQKIASEQPSTTAKEKKLSSDATSSSQKTNSTPNSNSFISGSVVEPFQPSLNPETGVEHEPILTGSEEKSDNSAQLGNKDEKRPALSTSFPIDLISATWSSSPEKPTETLSPLKPSQSKSSVISVEPVVAASGAPFLVESQSKSSLTSVAPPPAGLGQIVEQTLPAKNAEASIGADQSVLSPGDLTARQNEAFHLQNQLVPITETSSISKPSEPASFIGSNWSSMQLSFQLKKSVPQSSSEAKSSAVEKMSPTTPAQGTNFHSNSEAVLNQTADANVSNTPSQFISQSTQAQVADVQGVVSAPVVAAKNISADRQIGAVGLGTNHATENAAANNNSSLNLSSPLNLPTSNLMNTPSHKVLNSNSEFTGVLRQVVHEVRNEPAISVLSPRRVSIEIQTPPGAVVNVYISRQNDQFRAQLSTSDPQALKWVQDQVGVLQQASGTSEVRWLPAQLESQQNEDSWRGNRNQDQPNPDERNGKKTPESQNPEDDFMNITTKIKGAV